ncbi:MAG: peptide ABC transporter ATP-binding protein [Rhodospirillaceae bacterium]|nr:peptide ABC transporter ATP-binding protein [Rhodospirillaceae bacterium]
MADSPLLSIQGLQIKFPRTEGDFCAVDDVSLAINRGEILGLAGESGSGKSLTALAVTHLIPPPGQIIGGRVIFDGVDVASLAPADLLNLRGGRIGMIFQDPMSALNPTFTIGYQISEAYRLHTTATPAAARARTIEFLERVGIRDAPLRVDSYPHQLSGGMRQRVMIAMALICEPDLLIADEPTTALDTTVQVQILDLLREMREQLGLSILFISHDLAVVSELADRVAIIYAGNLMEILPAKSLANAACHPYSTGLLATLPTIEKRGRRLPVLEGMLEDADRERPGCPFAPRCPAAIGACSQEMPVLNQLSERHFAACHLIGGSL